MSDSALSLPGSLDMPYEEVAAQLLVTVSALEDLTLEDAFNVVAYMRLKRMAPGTVFMREGEVKRNDHMLLVLEGDITVESGPPAPHGSMMVCVRGPGHLIGEMGLLDGLPRSATCTTSTEVYAAVLSRAALMRLLRDKPKVGARLLLAISKRMADRLRETDRKLRLFAQMNKILLQELQETANSQTPPLQR